jgi:hypothetical protein
VKHVEACRRAARRSETVGVGTVAVMAEQAGPCGPDGFPHGLHLVGAQAVDRHRVAERVSRGEIVDDIDRERVAASRGGRDGLGVVLDGTRWR